MEIKEKDIGAWGWYFDNSKLSLSDCKRFMENFILRSLKYGVNLSTVGSEIGLDSLKDTQKLVDYLFDTTQSSPGNPLQKAINYNYYSKRLSSRLLPSIIFSENIRSAPCLYKDVNSTLFCTSKNGEFYSCYFHLRSNVFTIDDQGDDYVYANLPRLNSYIRSLHDLTQSFHCSLFDFTVVKNSKEYSPTNNGFLMYKDEVLFYEDVYDILPNQLSYQPFKEVELS